MASRRKFLNCMVGVSATTLLPTTSYTRDTDPEYDKARIFPKALKKGDTIGLIAPGYTFSEETLISVKKIMVDMGFKIYHTNRISQRHGYFSNTDKERADDLNHMFSNPMVNGILCIRGGYGCTRIMDLIDYNLIANNPKVLIGFSDVTALLNGIYKITGLVTFHGPVGSTLDDKYSQKALLRMVKKPKEIQELKNAKITNTPRLDSDFDRYVINPGIARGRLCGGSLTLINSLIGTPHEIDFTNKIVCIEDVEEAPYRIDRMLTQLLNGPTFKKAAGIVFGVCKGCNSTTNPNSFTLKEVIIDRIKPLGVPAAYGFSFGHIEQNFTFPIGANAIFDAKKLTIELTEKPVF